MRRLSRSRHRVIIGVWQEGEEEGEAEAEADAEPEPPQSLSQLLASSALLPGDTLPPFIIYVADKQVVLATQYWTLAITATLDCLSTDTQIIMPPNIIMPPIIYRQVDHHAPNIICVALTSCAGTLDNCHPRLPPHSTTLDYHVEVLLCSDMHDTPDCHPIIMPQIVTLDYHPPHCHPTQPPLMIHAADKHVTLYISYCP